MHEGSSVLREVGHCPDRELIAKLQRLVRADRALSVQLLVHLGEMDARGLYRELAYPSMFEYAVRALRMSEAEAYLRIQVARLGRQFPRVLELLGSGALHLTAIKLLAPHLTLDNHVQLLERARGMSKREVELLVAEIAPKPDVPNRLRKLPQQLGTRTRQAQLPQSLGSHISQPQPPGPLQAVDVTARQASGVQPDSAGCAAQQALAAECLPVAADAQRATFALQPPRVRASCTPLRPGRYKLQLSVAQEVHDSWGSCKICGGIASLMGTWRASSSLRCMRCSTRRSNSASLRAPLRTSRLALGLRLRTCRSRTSR